VRTLVFQYIDDMSGQSRRNSINSGNHSKNFVEQVFLLKYAKDRRRDNDHNRPFKRSPLGVRIVLLLFLFGLIAGLVNGTIQLAADAISQNITKLLSDTRYIPAFFFVAMFLAVASAGICRYFCRQATGSGLPEVRYILSSEMRVSEWQELISVRVLITKAVGLICGASSGLSIGTEGPMVHTAACIAHIIITSTPEFSVVLESPALVKQIFAASAAVGVASSFNAPVGGLLFSVETTSTFYLISNYWKSFVAATTGSIVCNLILQSGLNISGSRTGLAVR
jgi:H+/Cl- antiporter ClcA